MCLFVPLRISPPRIKLAASNNAWWFIGVQGRESHILGNFAPPEARNRTYRQARWPCLHQAIHRNGADVGLACVDIWPSAVPEGEHSCYNISGKRSDNES